MKIWTHEEMQELNDCVNVQNEDLSDIRKLAEEMIQTCVSGGGVGLACPQVGVNANMFIYSPDAKEFHIVINPVLFPLEKKKTKSIEQCLSLEKDQFYYIERYKYVSVKYYSISPNSDKLIEIKRRLRGEEAIIFQHEYDHLRGITLEDNGRRIDG